MIQNKWTASSEFGTYRLCEQRRFRRACASAQSRQDLRCSLIQAVSQEEPSDRKPDPWPLWMAGHAQLKFVMTECSKTQIRLTGPEYLSCTVKAEKILFSNYWYSMDGTTSGLTHICLMDQSILINWTSPFPILGVSGVLFNFYSISNR